MPQILMKDLGEAFVPANPEPNKSYRLLERVACLGEAQDRGRPQIPKHNTRFLELEPEITDERTISLSVSSDTSYYYHLQQQP